jgi:hypothetical protein
MYLEEAQEGVDDEEDVVNELKTLHRVVVLWEYQTKRKYVKGNDITSME